MIDRKKKKYSKKELPMQGNTGKHNEIPNYLEVKVCEQYLSLYAKEEGLVSKKS